MRLGIALPHFNQLSDAESFGEIARAAERLGFDSIWVSDHVIVPADTPFLPDDIAEPLAVLAYLAAVTDRITLGTGVLVLPYRNTIFTAKFLYLGLSIPSQALKSPTQVSILLPHSLMQMPLTSSR